MRKKKRSPISLNIADEIQFLSDRTCCICRESGKNTQIHHVDENPFNNQIENLAILCFECHEKTQLKGGFGRKLNSSLIIKYRKDWLQRVQKRRDNADELASIKSVTGQNNSNNENSTTKVNYIQYDIIKDQEILIDYMNKILILNKAQFTINKNKLISGITSKMVEGNYNIIEAVPQPV